MFHTFSFLSCHFSSSSFFFFFLTFLFASCFFCFFCSRERERERKKSCQSQRISFSEKRKKIGKIVPQTHNILFKPTETLAKNTKNTKTPNARKKMLRPPVESRFQYSNMRGVPGWQLTRCIVPTLLRGAESIRMIYRARAGTFFCIFCAIAISLNNLKEAVLLLFTTFRKNLRFGEAERAHIQ